MEKLNACGSYKMNCCLDQIQLHCSYSVCREVANLLDLQTVSSSVLSKGAGKDVCYMNLEKRTPYAQVLQTFVFHSLAQALGC